VSGCSTKVTDCGIRVTGCSTKVTDCGIRVTGCSTKVTDCDMRATDCGGRERFNQNLLALIPQSVTLVLQPVTLIP
jgi:hypothetical protein